MWPQYLGSEQPGSGAKASATQPGAVWELEVAVTALGAAAGSCRRFSAVPFPPLQTGYMFGKGIYFADMVSKSANYCHAFQGDPVGLILLGEVALGNM